MPKTAAAAGTTFCSNGASGFVGVGTAVVAVVGAGRGPAAADAAASGARGSATVVDGVEGVAGRRPATVGGGAVVVVGRADVRSGLIGS
jgi:hypothetical protein